jgi:hypothetical protein
VRSIGSGRTGSRGGLLSVVSCIKTIDTAVVRRGGRNVCP